MRIIHVDTGREWRGGQSQVLMLARGLSRYDCDTTIVAKQRSPLAQRARAEGVSCEELPLRFEADIASARELATLADSSSPTVLHAHTPHALGLVILAMQFGAKHPVIFTRRVSFPIKKLAITRWKLNCADRIIAVSEAVSAELSKAGIEQTKIRVIHSAVDTELFGYTGPSHDHPRNIAILNATEQDKGIEQAMEFVAGANLPVIFHFIGAGPRLAELEDFVADRKDAVVHGFVSDIESMLSKMYAAISFSLSEGFPNLVLQSMATGLPVMAFENEAIREMMSEGDVGFMFRSLSESQLQLQRLLENRQESVEMGVRARELVTASFSVRQMVDKTLSLYKEILS